MDMGYDETMLFTPGPMQDQIQAYVQQDFVKVDVYYQTLNVQTISQDKKYTVRFYMRYLLF
jgi:hypothetical protein